MAAFAYVERGWSAVPVNADKKASIPWKEFQSRVATPAELREFFDRFPEAGVAIVAGSISHLLVLDADGPPGVAEVEKLGIPRTPTVATPRNGRHYYFTLPSGVGFGNRAKIGTSRAIDVRCNGGYVVAPPSIGMSGTPYVWIVSPDLTRPALPPPWLIAMLTASPTRAMRSRGGGVAPLVVPSAIVPSVGSNAALRGILDHVPHRLRRIIVRGHRASRGRYPSRSEADQAVALALVRAGASDEQIEAVFRTFPVGAKLREKSADDARLYLELAIGNARTLAEYDGAPVRARIKYADPVSTPPGMPPGVRIYLKLIRDDNQRVVSVGVSVPDEFRACGDRYEALWAAAGLPIPKRDGLDRACARLIGRRIGLVLDDGSDRRNPVRLIVRAPDRGHDVCGQPRATGVGVVRAAGR